MKTLYCFLGHSGVGKTSVVNLLAKELHLKVLQSYTDRPKRFEGEEGHIFLSPEEYDKITGIVAETLFNGHRYCATAEQIDSNDLYVVDIGGLRSISRRYLGDKDFEIIFLSASEETRRARMLNEGRPEDSVNERIEHDRTAFKEANLYATHVVDAEKPLLDVVSEIKQIILGG